MRPSLPSAVAYLALAGFVAETRLELAALRRSEAALRRRLGESEGGSVPGFVTTEQLELELGQLREEGAAAAERLGQDAAEKTGEVREGLDALRADVDELRKRRKRRRRAQRSTCGDAQAFRNRSGTDHSLLPSLVLPATDRVIWQIPSLVLA